MTNQHIRWGILSTANIGAKRVIPAIHASRNGVVAAVASRDLNRAQTFASAHSIPTAYGTYDDLIADKSIDAIYIPTPNSQHAEWALLCAQAGKPTLCEKPLAIHAEQAQTMVDAFEKAGVLFAEAFMYRFHPQHEHVRQIIQRGGIGEVRLIDASFSFALWNEGNIRLSKDLAGGALMDVGCYCVNVMRFLTGEEPVSAQAIADFGAQTGVDETFTGLLRFPSGVVGHFDASLRMHRVHRYEVRGTEGRIVVDEAFVPDLTPDTTLTVRHWQGNTYTEIQLPGVDQYRLMVEDFADALLEGRPVRFAPQDAIANMRAIDMLMTAAHANA